MGGAPPGGSVSGLVLPCARSDEPLFKAVVQSVFVALSLVACLRLPVSSSE